MLQSDSDSNNKFHDAVGIKFQLYNSLFLSLPFFGIDKTGILLSLFNSHCEDSYAAGENPSEIINSFFERHTPAANAEERAGLLFRFVQYTERQVVLFDALEDAAFSEVNDMTGPGTIKQLASSVSQRKKETDFLKRLNEFSVRLVLTAHPTQFYPGTVLGIINDLVDAIAVNDVSLINTYLQQLGRTPFFKKQKPTPFDEAQSLIWYLENVFYHAIGGLISDLRKRFPHETVDFRDLVEMGFWSGGDRDGNPFVTVDTTLRVADALNRSILKCYYHEVRSLKRRLTFTEVDVALAELERELYDAAYQTINDASITRDQIGGSLLKIRETLLKRHDGLFVHLVDELIAKVDIFGTHFASLDIRQESDAHEKIIEHIAEVTNALTKNFAELTDTEKIDALLRIGQSVDPESITDELAKDTLRNVAAVRAIQTKNGSKGCERYIISQCRSALNAVEVIGLFLLGGCNLSELDIDVVPLFETITDLQNSLHIMKTLYEIPAYREHLKRRSEKQTIMLGFSDGTKDGGYLMANWSIYKAKDELTWLSRKYGIDVIFFDGRGGPPARGGGKTHRFYSSMGKNIAGDAIQVTVQGQTVSSNFGTVDAARYNIEQLLHAGTYNHIFAAKAETLSESEKVLLERLANESFRAYSELKDDPSFLEYLANVSPLRFYAETNIGSRPAKRGSGKLTLKDLRAIPFVGAWSQLKQNVPGFYGVGSALKTLDDQGKLAELKLLYNESPFFKTLMDNSEMAMQKCFFPLTAHLANDPEYAAVWNKIHDEFELSRKYLAILSGTGDLMSDLPNEQQSVQTREKIVIPLTTIQQFALARIADEDPLKATFEKLVMRCSFGIINAGRNSA